jgi:dimethylamine/trimethylamine dehydrogenase
MAEVIRGGHADLIGAARPSISDPFLPRKIEEGRYDEVRECIGCNACYSRSVWGLHLGCTQNPTAGEEHRRGWHPERFERAANAEEPVLVVGAGPAGMECAMVLGKRGFELVHLVDSGEDIGGQMRWVTRLPGLGEWGHVVAYRRAQLDRLANVEPVLATALDAAAVREYGAKIVVVATGARWAGDGMNGITRAPIPGADASLPHVLLPEDIMVDGTRPDGRRVTILDCEGYFTAAGLAEVLRAEGHEVTFVTPYDVVAPTCDQTLEGLRLRRHLHDLGIDLRTALTPTEVLPGGLRVEDGVGRPSEIEADATVLVTQRLSDDAFYRELAGDPEALSAAGIAAVYRVGDCVAPRLIADAIFDGHRLAREIDGPDPAVARPYLRERPLIPG